MLFILSINLALTLVSAAPVLIGGSAVEATARQLLQAGNTLTRTESASARLITSNVATSMTPLRKANSAGALTKATELESLAPISALPRTASALTTMDSKGLSSVASLTAAEKSSVLNAQGAMFGPQTKFDAIMEGRKMMQNPAGKYDPLVEFPAELTKTFPSMTVDQQKAVLVVWFEGQGKSVAEQQALAVALAQAKVDSKEIKILTGIALVTGAAAIGTGIGLGFVENNDADLRTQLEIQSQFNARQVRAA